MATKVAPDLEMPASKQIPAILGSKTHLFAPLACREYVDLVESTTTPI